MSEPPNLDGLKIDRGSHPERRSPKMVLVGALLLVALAGGAWWWFMQGEAVDIHSAVAQEASANTVDRTVLNASGYVTARREATVSSKVTGKVNEVLVEEGTRVVADQVLARLDDSNITTSLRLARAQADAAKSGLQETKVRLAEAEQELQRQTELRKSEAAAQSDFDHAKAAADALRAHLAQQQSEVQVADQTVAVWQQQLDDTVIRAPFAGTVTSKNAQPGEMISPMSTGGFTRTGICTIVDMDSLEIEIDVNESYINRVSPGQPVEATLDAYPDWRIPCHVVAIIPTADRNKSTVRVRVGFDRLDPRILPDMSVKVAFRDTAARVEAARHTVLVPKSALHDPDGRPIVFVVHGAHVERRAVVVGNVEGDHALITAGVAAGERVVIDATKPLSDGMPVKEPTP